MRRFLLRLSVGSLLGLASGVAGDDAPSPVDAWTARAMENNPQLKASRQMWLAAEAKVGGATSLPDPMIGADVERANTTFSDYNDIEYMVQQDIPGFGKRGARRDIAQLLAEAEGFVFLEDMRDLRGKVRAAAWDLWKAEQTLSIMRGNVGLMQRMQETALAQYEAGRVMQGDVLRAQIEQARMGNEVANMERDRDVALAALNTLLGDPPQTQRSTGDMSLELPGVVADMASMQDKARKSCCILLSTMRKRDAMAAAVRSAKAERRPDIQLRAEARQFKDGSGIEEYDTGIFLNIPWIWGGKYRSMIREAEAELSKAEADLEEETNRTLLDIQELHTMTTNAQRTRELLVNSLLPKAKSMLDSALAAYQSGQVRLVEVIDARRTMQDIQRDSINATAELGRNEAMLAVIAGPWGPDEIATGLVSEDMNDE